MTVSQSEYCGFFSKEENKQIPNHSPFKTKDPKIGYTSFVRRRSVMV